MAITITVFEDQGILKVTYTPEEVTQKDLEEQRKMVADAIAENGIRKVLIDASGLRELPPVVTIFEHNVAVSTESNLLKAKFAVLCKTLGENERFLETTGLNRGVQIGCFTSMEDALSWLGE